MNIIELKKEIEQKLANNKDIFDFLKTKDILINKGFLEKEDTEIQNLFYEMFPPSEELLFEMENSLKNIFSEDVDTRIKTSNYILNQASGVTSSKTQSWLKDPRSIEIIRKALDDANEKVVINIVIMFGELSHRYNYGDLKTFTKLVNMFNLSVGKLKYELALSICQFPYQEKWQYVYDTFKNTTKTKEKEVLARVIGWDYENIPADYKEKFLSQIAEFLKKEKNENTIDSLEKLQKKLLG